MEYCWIGSFIRHNGSASGEPTEFRLSGQLSIDHAGLGQSGWRRWSRSHLERNRSAFTGRSMGGWRLGTGEAAAVSTPGSDARRRFGGAAQSFSTR